MQVLKEFNTNVELHNLLSRALKASTGSGPTRPITGLAYSKGASY